MPKFKKIIVNSYSREGSFITKATMMTETGIAAVDFECAKSEVAMVIQRYVLNIQKFTVEWKRDGNIEGYLVDRDES